MRWLTRFMARRRLERSLKPDPQYRQRRLAQFSPERRQRYFDNIASIKGE